MSAQNLSAKLQSISVVLPIDKILGRNSADIKQISRYYRKNRLAYRIFNSKKGFVHMGISQNDTFCENDYYAQGNLISASIDEMKAKDILELAPGKAATTKYLAAKHIKSTFYCIDLEHGQFKDSAKLSNIKAAFGDYHDLSKYSDNSMDIVYVIEALCHAADKQKVINEVYRVLREGGQFIVIDGYYTPNVETRTSDEVIAMRLVAKSMMVNDADQTYEHFVNCLAGVGFTVLNQTNYSKNIMPSLRRLEQLAARFFKRPRLAKFLTIVMGDIVTANAAAGYLMPYCIENNLFEYRYTVSVKNTR